MTHPHDPEGERRKLDLACLEVDQPLSERDNIRFFEISEATATEPVETTELACIGFPSDLAVDGPEGSHIAFPNGLWSKTEQVGNRLLEGFNPLVHLLITDDQSLARHPRGFSGTGVWFHQGPTAVWHPNLRLAGLCVIAYHRISLLAIIKPSVLLKFLAAM